MPELEVYVRDPMFKQLVERATGSELISLAGDKFLGFYRGTDFMAQAGIRKDWPLP